MPTQCSGDLFGYEVVEGRRVVAAFDGGQVTSDAVAQISLISIQQTLKLCRAGLDPSTQGAAGARVRSGRGAPTVSDPRTAGGE